MKRTLVSLAMESVDTSKKPIKKQLKANYIKLRRSVSSLSQESIFDFFKKKEVEKKYKEGDAAKEIRTVDFGQISELNLSDVFGHAGDLKTCMLFLKELEQLVDQADHYAHHCVMQYVAYSLAFKNYAQHEHEKMIASAQNADKMDKSRLSFFSQLKPVDAEHGVYCTATKLIHLQPLSTGATDANTEIKAKSPSDILLHCLDNASYAVMTNFPKKKDNAEAVLHIEQNQIQTFIDSLLHVWDRVEQAHHRWDTDHASQQACHDVEKIYESLERANDETAAEYAYGFAEEYYQGNVTWLVTDLYYTVDELLQHVNRSIKK